MASLVRLSMSRDVLLFISFRVLLTSDVMIGGTSDASGLLLFCEGCRSLGAELYSSV